MNTTMASKTRIAPTPSGFLHLGNILSFAITAGLARDTGASILLRIDDLDRSRMRLEYLQDIFNTLDFLGIPWDTGPRDATDFLENWSQTKRLNIYKLVLQELANSGFVYACRCSRKDISSQMPEDGGCNCRDEKIPLESPEVSWRWLLKMGRPISYHDFLVGPVTSPIAQEIQHFVVRKKDGMPSYQLASVLDDHHFGVDLIVRGADLHNSTLMQLHLSQRMQQSNFPRAHFLHHDLLRDSLGEKLSKSAGATSVHFLRQQGMSPASIFELISSMFDLQKKANSWQTLYAAWKAENIR
jgi:glutamyl/glutaminyl-tRNA synthetase